jgi:membrane protein
MAEAPTTGDVRFLSRVARWPFDLARTLVRVVPVAIDGYFRDRLGQHAAAIAYRVLFSLAPLTIVLVSIVGVVLRNDARRQDVIDEIVGWLPVTEEGSNTVEDAITRLASPTSVVGIFSLLVFFWAATGMMASLRTGLEAALRVERRRPAARGKLVDVVLVAGAGALVIAMIAVAVVAQVVTRFVDSAATVVGFEGGLLAEVIRAVVPILVTTVVVMLLYRFVPSRRLRFGDTVAGGIVTGVLLLAISAASAYVYDRVTELSVIYGSITVVLVFLYSVYLYASAVLFGAEVAAAWSAPPAAGPPEPVMTQLRRAVLGLFVRREPPSPPAESLGDPKRGRHDGALGEGR